MLNGHMKMLMVGLLIVGLVALAGCATHGKRHGGKCGSDGACPSGKCSAKASGDAACPSGKCSMKSLKGDAKEACECGKAECKKCSAKGGKGSHENEARLNTATLALLLSKDVPLTVLDARSGKYDDGRRIPGAKALAPTATADEAAKVIPSKDALVVTYCSNLQCPASAKLAKQLRTLGYTNVIEYPHGIDGWAKAGNEVETAAK